ncbi:hypothetical protein GU926_17765 [Nibribacter ruber]|uniref:Uncharacterized protein n=1 Tax=Nibribacter ruber TaxID=2698458 RepID=A0A6P1P4C4_9BACT|nr:hypothetical protein [Nibribacter ruber]QHL89176.1 hypothetical protein GU926_17765 [Nibribacter ruber]
MKKFIPFLFFIALCALASPAYSQVWEAPIPLLPNSALKDIVKANYNDSLQSYVIEYNPVMALEVGPFVTAFFQAHEYGHIYRAHVNKKRLNKASKGMLQLTREFEIAADAFACETFFSVDRSYLFATLHYLESEGEHGKLTSVPTPERIHLINLIMQRLSIPPQVAQKKDCVHKMHEQDIIPCDHSPYHAGGHTTTCMHKAHLDGCN